MGWLLNTALSAALGALSGWVAQMAYPVSGYTVSILSATAGAIAGGAAAKLRGTSLGLLGELLFALACACAVLCAIAVSVGAKQNKKR